MRRPETELGSAARGNPTNLNTKTGVSRPATREESGETKEETREGAAQGPVTTLRLPPSPGPTRTDYRGHVSVTVDLTGFAYPGLGTRYIRVARVR